MLEKLDGGRVSLSHQLRSSVLLLLSEDVTADSFDQAAPGTDSDLIILEAGVADLTRFSIELDVVRMIPLWPPAKPVLRRTGGMVGAGGVDMNVVWSKVRLECHQGSRMISKNDPTL